MSNITGYRIRGLRSDLNWTAEQLALKIGVNRANVTQWEIGKNYPSKDNLVSLAKALNTSTDYLLGLTEDKRPINEIIFKDGGKAIYVGDMSDDNKNAIKYIVDTFRKSNGI